MHLTFNGYTENLDMFQNSSVIQFYLVEIIKDRNIKNNFMFNPESHRQEQSDESSMHSLRVEASQKNAISSSFMPVRPSVATIKSSNQNVRPSYTNDKLESGIRQEEQSGVSVGGGKRKNHKKSQISNFIMKTYRILEDSKNKNAIHWTDEGNCFIVKDKDIFENFILPKYFKHKKFSSFVRQLNMYDFHKIRKQKQIPIFKHKYFKQGCVQLLHKIKRKSGDDVKEANGEQQQLYQNQSAGFLPSLADLTQKPFPSAYSIKSKAMMPYPTSTNHLVSNNPASQLDHLIQENQQLSSSISQLTHQLASIEVNHERKKQKIVKIISALTYFQLSGCDQIQEERQYQPLNLRDMQNHITSEQEPLTFQQYTSYLSKIYSTMKSSLSFMKINNESKPQQIEQEERKVNNDAQ